MYVEFLFISIILTDPSIDIRRFDTQVIPFDGPGGLVTRVEKLLDTAPPPRLQEREKYELLDRFIKVVLHNT